jgi:glycosyltransferase involved in cell wall biosynthesis
MRIGLLHYTAPPIVGGVEQVMANQANVCSLYGHEVIILAGRGQAWDESIRVNTVDYLDSRDPEILNIKADLDSGVLTPSFAAMAERSYRWLQNNSRDLDVLIAHNVATMHKNLPLTAALHRLAEERANGLRIILWHHDFAWTASQYRQEMYAAYPWNLTKKAWDGVIHVVISEARKAEMVELTGIDPARVKVIPNGIDQFQVLGLSKETVRLVHRFKLQLAEPLFLAPVRITRRKNLELALRIIAQLRADFPRVFLVITGPTGAHNPANQAYLQELTGMRKDLGLEEHVLLLAEHYPAGVSSTQIADLYRLSDALLMTSIEEGFGLPVLEAGLGKQVLFCSDIPALRALSHEAATFFSIGEPEEQIARRIVDRLQSDAAYQLRARVKREYSWDSIYLNHIEPLLTLAIDQVERGHDE